MSDGKFGTQTNDKMLETTLVLLDAVEKGEPLSQRSLAARLGVALGLTNSLIKRCVKKGLLKVSNAPAKRFAYYLTPKGFSEKSRLTAEYLSYSLKFFRQARGEYDEIFELCAKRGFKRVALYGTSELAEIATLSANGSGVELVAIIDPTRNVFEFCNLPVKADIATASADGELDAVVMTTTEDTQESYIKLIEQIDESRVLVPELLFISYFKDEPEEEAGVA